MGSIRSFTMRNDLHTPMACRHIILLIGFFACLCLSQLFTSSAEGAETVIIDSTGIGCVAPVGSWNPETKTCTLISDLSFIATGIRINSNGITLDGNGHTLTGPGVSSGIGVYLYQRSSVTVKNLTITSSRYGIQQWFSDNNQILLNNISGTRYGIFAAASNYNLITENQVSGSTSNGIFLASSTDGTNISPSIQNTISNNRVSGSTGFGIYLSGKATNNLITGNTTSAGGVGIRIADGADSNIIDNNDASGHSQSDIFISRATGNVASHNQARNSYAGISCSEADSTEISGNSVEFTSPASAISLARCNNSLVIENTALGLGYSGPQDASGISIAESSNVSLLRNKVSNFSKGIVFNPSTSGNRAQGNILESCWAGIHDWGSGSNSFIGNTLSLNNYGAMIAAPNEIVYNNNFINNTVQISGGDATSIFSMPAYIGGNHWSNYDTDADGCHDANGDHFCDSPYSFAGGSDNLPWTTDTTGRPAMRLMTPNPYWASYADYLSRDLTVVWTIINSGANNAHDVVLTNSVNSDGVTILAAMPVSVSEIIRGGNGSAEVSLKYHVPADLIRWQSTLHSIANDAAGVSYAYPEA